MTVRIYVVGANFSKIDDIVILREVIRFTGLCFHKEKYVIIFIAVRWAS